MSADLRNRGHGTLGGVVAGGTAGLGRVMVGAGGGTPVDAREAKMGLVQMRFWCDFVPLGEYMRLVI